MKNYINCNIPYNVNFNAVPNKEYYFFALQ